VSRRTRFSVIDPYTNDVLSMITLFGDQDQDTRAAIETMMSEAMAIVHVVHGSETAKLVREVIEI